jgi:flagellar motor switch protein FliM
VSRKSAAKAAQPASLVGASCDSPAFPGLDRIARKLERGLADVFTQLLASPASVAAAPIRIEDQPAAERMELRHIRLAPLKGAMGVGMERDAIVRLVDLYYGGEGTGTGPTEKLSLAEGQLFTRIADAFCGILPAAWLPFGTICAELDDDTASSGAVAVQDFTISWQGSSQMRIECRFPVRMLEGIPQLKSAEAAPADQLRGDEGWEASLTSSALTIPFPVRAVFAEPWLPITRLMSLQPGDVIPICLPGEIDLMISGRRFARGQVGESNGRAAVSIEQI